MKIEGEVELGCSDLVTGDTYVDANGNLFLALIGEQVANLKNGFTCDRAEVGTLQNIATKVVIEDDAKENAIIEHKPDEPHQNTVAKFVLLEGIEHGFRFFSAYTPGDDPTKSATGKTWYRVLGYAATVEEVQRILYG